MILIINKSRKDGNSAVEIFRYMGVLARAETPDTAFSEISLMYRAVLVMNPHKLPDENDYIKSIRSYDSKMPIFAISNREIANKDLYDMTFPDDITSSKLLGAILDYCKEHNHLLLGEYMLSGINASIDLGGVIYYNDVIPFTKTETMILRLLIRTFPSPISTREILKYAFSQSRLPEESGVRTHISSMNKKFKSVSGHSLICSSNSQGYIISTPMLEHNISISAV